MLNREFDGFKILEPSNSLFNMSLSSYLFGVTKIKNFGAI